jgi:hypothetical protein
MKNRRKKAHPPGKGILDEVLRTIIVKVKPGLDFASDARSYRSTAATSALITEKRSLPQIPYNRIKRALELASKAHG